MAEKLDLNKLKTEISSRRGNRNTTSNLGESVGNGVAPRDEFLSGLINSLHTGQETPATNLIKIVENKVATKHGETARHPIATIPNVGQNVPVNTQQRPVEMSPERDELMYAQFAKNNKQTLAESISGYVNGYINPNTNTPNYNPQQPQYINQQQPQSLNENYLVENVKKIVNNQLIDMLGPILEEAMRDTIIEMYTVDKVKSILQENKDIVKSLVIETIKEIQQKNKAR
jgi:hypothetical protein